MCSNSFASNQDGAHHKDVTASDKIVTSCENSGIVERVEIYISFIVTMMLTIRALLLGTCLSVCATSHMRTLAFYVTPARDLDLEAAAVMRAELRELLLPAGIDLVWKNMSERKAGETFDLVAVSSFEGSCASAEVVSPLPAPTLADTSIANGRILPFFRIDCSRLVGMLPSGFQPVVLGRALARIAAHEVYHIVARTAEHEKSGIAKASLSSQELAANRLEFDALSIARMLPLSNTQQSEIALGIPAR